jgi:hypothetical protein
MRLEFGLAIVIAVSTFTSSPVVQAQDITPDGVARSASLFSAIAHYCPSHLKVDPEAARKFVRAYVMVGENVEGAKAFKTRLGRETTRRSKEVDITGPFQWCTRQKALLQSHGDQAVFP